MSKIQWEYDLAERPFCEQLRAMGWRSIAGVSFRLLSFRVHKPTAS